MQATKIHSVFLKDSVLTLREARRVKRPTGTKRRQMSKNVVMPCKIIEGQLAAVDTVVYCPREAQLTHTGVRIGLQAGRLC